MTEKLGAIKLGTSDSAPFLGRDFAHQRDYSENVAAIVDQEIRQLIEDAHQEAYEILVQNRATLDALVEELMEKETLNKEEIAKIFAKVNGRPPRPAWTGSPLRKPSSLPPIEIKERANESDDVKKPRKKRAQKSDE
jgi:cell division protease FtsH